MSQVITTGTCGSPRPTEWTGGLLPADPFTSVRYHYGMLLGEEDFVADQAYHRGKQRLHNAALHGAGVVWGFDVGLVTDEGGATGEVEVGPGLALDPHGHELHIDRRWCADLAQWFALHREDDGMDVRRTGNTVVFDAHVVLCFRACLARPVPALVDGCDPDAADVECSRVRETVRLALRPGPAPPRGSRAGHLMRIFFGLEAPRDEYATARQREAALLARTRHQAVAAETDPQARAALVAEACGRLAALDTVLWARAGDGPFPAVPEDCVVLAQLADVTLEPAGEDGWTLVSAAVDVGVRRTLLATEAIQELLCGCPCGGDRPRYAEAPARQPRPAGDPEEGDAGGARVDAAKVRVRGKRVVLPFEGRPLKASVEEPGAIAVESFRSSGGWKGVPIAGIAVKRAAGGASVEVELAAAPPRGALRVVVRGTGQRPVLSRSGRDFLPFAGAVGGPPAGRTEGRDFVHMITVRS